MLPWRWAAIVVSNRCSRPVQHVGVAPGEIAARGPAVGHEQAVADKDRVANEVGHAVIGVPGRGDDATLQRPDTEGFVVAEQVIELPPVRCEVLLQVQQFLEGRLDLADAPAYGNFPAELPLEKGRGAQVVRMGVGLEDPVELQATVPDECGHLPDGPGSGPSRVGVEIERRVDDGRGLPVMDHVSPGRGLLVQEWLYLRPVHGRSLLPILADIAPASAPGRQMRSPRGTSG